MDFTSTAPQGDAPPSSSANRIHRRILSAQLLGLLAAPLLIAGCAATRPRLAHQSADLKNSPKTDIAAAKTEDAKPADPGLQTEKIETAKDEPKPVGESPPERVAEVKTPTPAASKEVVPSTFVGEGGDEFARIRALVDRTVKYYQSVNAYTCRITRQERVGQKLMPVEVMEMRFRRQPRSVYYRWLNEENEGRECVYVEGANNGNVVTRGGKGDPFFLVGKTIALDPNGMLARSKSRYSITQSGLDNMTRRMQEVLEEIESGKNTGFAVSDQGLKRRDESPTPLRHIQQTIARGADPLFPEGGVRDWYFDPETSRLVLMEAFAPEQQLMEYYHFDRFFENDLIDDSDFDPEVLWPKPGAQRPADSRPTRTAENEPRLPK